MSEIMNSPIVLVLNRNWQAIHVKTPAQAFCMMSTDVATALDIQGEDDMRPVRWKDWIGLPVRDDDHCAKTVHGAIRIPTVIVLANYAKVPHKRPKLSRKTIWERDGGTCQYTGKKITKPDEGNIDHVVPRSKGGETSWENCVLSHVEINSLKGDRLPHEVGLRLLRTPYAPKPIPATFDIRNKHNVKDWDIFCHRRA